MSIRVFRVQDAEGRGPYRPGYSHTWTDADHDRNPPMFDEFGWPANDKISDLWNPNETGGCAFRTLEQLHKWFSPTERARLERSGYSIVTLSVDRIIAESDRQLVFGRIRPLRNGCAVLPWTASVDRSAA